MGGNHQIRGKLGFADDVHKHIQTALSVPHVNMSIAPLPAYQSRGVGLSQKVLHFRPGRLGERRSDRAVFAPITLSTKMMSRLTEPVREADGISKEPVSMRAVIPSASREQTFA